jgi:hypothetical protein
MCSCPKRVGPSTYIHEGKELFKFGLFVFESIAPKQNFALNLTDFTKLEGHWKNYLSHLKVPQIQFLKLFSKS